MFLFLRVFLSHLFKKKGGWSIDPVQRRGPWTPGPSFLPLPLNDFERKAKKRKFPYVLQHVLSNMIPRTTIRSFEPCFEFRESCLSLARKISSVNKQCGDKTYLLRPSSLSCALKFASLVVLIFSCRTPLNMTFGGSFSLFAFTVQINLYALYVCHYRCELLAFIFTYII